MLTPFAVVDATSVSRGLDSLLFCLKVFDKSLDPLLTSLGVEGKIASVSGELNSSVPWFKGFEMSLASVLRAFAVGVDTPFSGELKSTVTCFNGIKTLL